MEQNNMDSDFVTQVRSCAPKNRLFFHTGRKLDAMIGLKDGSLMTVPTSGRSISLDGGLTWTDTEFVHDVDGNQIACGFRRLVRLKSGGIGGFCRENDSQTQRYGMSPWFRRSDDEGRTWSKPMRVGEPYNTPYCITGLLLPVR